MKCIGLRWSRSLVALCVGHVAVLLVTSMDILAMRKLAEHTMNENLKLPGALSQPTAQQPAIN